MIDVQYDVWTSHKVLYFGIAFGGRRTLLEGSYRQFVCTFF